MQSFKNFVIEEGKLGKLAALGALATGSAFGSFVDDWSKYYQTSEDPSKESRASAVLERGFNVPSDAKKAIDTAVYIFGNDEGKSPNMLKDYLEKTGAVESDYRTKVQHGDGPARSYWQVEPATAMDLVKNSSAYFGPKFHEVFGKDALKILKTYDKNQWSEILEKNDALGASMAAAKWLATSW